MIAYTRAQIWEQLDAQSSDMSNFYKSGCVNYRGETSDTKEPYTEVIAEWLMQHLELLEQIQTITRQASYQVAGHDGIPEHPDSNREEELLAMAMKRQVTLPYVGTILDYQTPLKNKQKDTAGKIDLLAYDGTTLRILELKAPDSKETMLRCVLEGFTYLKTVDRAKLLLNFDLPADTVVAACPFTFYGGFQWEEMQQERPWLKKLMAALHSTPLYIKQENEQFIVTEE